MIIFPPNPAIGEVFRAWTWNGKAWTPPWIDNPTADLGTEETPGRLVIGHDFIFASDFPGKNWMQFSESPQARLWFDTFSGWYYQFASRTILSMSPNGDVEIYRSLAIGNNMTLGTTNLRVVSDQVYKPTAGGWLASSDVRLKTIERNYTHGLAEIEQLTPIVYKLKGNGGFTAQDGSDGCEHIGLIGQAAETVMPEMITQKKGYVDGAEVDDLRVIDTSPLTFALLNAVKDLSQQVRDLTKRVAELEASNG